MYYMYLNNFLNITAYDLHSSTPSSICISCITECHLLHSFLNGICIVYLVQPLIAKELIDKLQTCSDEELVSVLQDVVVWRYGKVIECALIRVLTCACACSLHTVLQ